MTLMIDRLDIARMRRLNGSDEEIVGKLLEAATQVFEISNVSDLVSRTDWIEHVDEKPVVDFSKFPNGAPPYETYWMEWRVPDRLIMNDRWKRLGRLGVWAIVNDTTSEDEWHVGIAVFAGDRKPIPVATGQLRFCQDGTAGEQIPLTVTDAGFAILEPPDKMKRTDDATALAEAIIGLGEEYEQLTDPDERLAFAEKARVEATAHLAEMNANFRKILDLWIRIVVYPPLLMAHSLLGCKNVETEIQTPPDKLRHANLRRHGRLGVRFTTLRIRPTGGARSDDRHVSIGDGMVALHLVRGHFKTFTPERPLLGRHVGTYWWSPTVRGKEEHGVVVKDYVVG